MKQGATSTLPRHTHVQIDKEYATRESSGSNETARDCFAQCSVAAAAAAAATLHSSGRQVSVGCCCPEARRRSERNSNENARRFLRRFRVCFFVAGVRRAGYVSRCCSASALLVRGLGARLRARFKQKIGAGGLYQARRRSLLASISHTPRRTRLVASS